MKTVGEVAKVIEVMVSEERHRCATIVREEWQKAVVEFGLRSGTVTEKVVSRIIERIG